MDITSKSDDYMACPNCGSMVLNRDIRDGVNSCLDCGFTHFVGEQTIQDAIENALADWVTCELCNSHMPSRYLTKHMRHAHRSEV